MCSLIYAFVLCKCKQAKNKLSNADALGTCFAEHDEFKGYFEEEKTQSQEQFTGIIENEQLIKTYN